MILMAAVFRTSDGLALCANTDTGHDSETTKICYPYVKILSKKFGSLPDRCTFHTEHFNFHFVSALDQTFLAFTEDTYPTVLAFCFLNELQRDFLQNYEHGKVQTARRPYSFMAFDPVIQKTKQRYNSPRNLSTRVNLHDTSEELKLRPPYKVNMDDLIPAKSNEIKINRLEQLGVRPAYHPDFHLKDFSGVGWLAASLNIFCGLLNFVRGMAIISHGHFDDSDAGAYRYGCAFLLSCWLNGFQIYLLYRSMRMRTTIAALSWLFLSLSICQVSHFRNILQIIFHLCVNTFTTLLIYKTNTVFKPPLSTV